MTQTTVEQRIGRTPHWHVWTIPSHGEALRGTTFWMTERAAEKDRARHDTIPDIKYEVRECECNANQVVQVEANRGFSGAVFPW